VSVFGFIAYKAEYRFFRIFAVRSSANILITFISNHPVRKTYLQKQRLKQ